MQITSFHLPFKYPMIAFSMLWTWPNLFFVRPHCYGFFSNIFFCWCGEFFCNLESGKRSCGMFFKIIPNWHRNRVSSFSGSSSDSDRAQFWLLRWLVFVSSSCLISAPGVEAKIFFFSVVVLNKFTWLHNIDLVFSCVNKRTLQMVLEKVVFA